MGRSDDFEVVSVILDDRGEADTGKDLVESVADVFEFVVEFLAVVLEPVLEAFEEVGGESRRRSGRDRRGRRWPRGAAR